VPAQEPGSSWPLTAVHTPMVHVWHAPAQSLLVTHPTHWLLAVSHLAATPVQCLSAVHATHRPLLAQAGPFRPVQSVSAAHFAHRLFKHRGLGDEQSLSVLQVPGASTVGASGPRSTTGASGAVTTAVPSGSAESATDPSSPGPALAPPEPPAPPLVLAPPEPPNPPIPPDPAPPPAASVDPLLSTATRPSVPLSGSKQRQSSVQTYPGLHGALGAQTSQSRFTQESPIVAGKTSARIIERTKRRFFMSGILGRGLKKLCGKWTKEWPGQERSFSPLRHTGSAVGRRLARRA
jgi:hypothetical protein